MNNGTCSNRVSESQLTRTEYGHAVTVIQNLFLSSSMCVRFSALFIDLLTQLFIIYCFVNLFLFTCSF